MSAPQPINPFAPPTADVDQKPSPAGGPVLATLGNRFGGALLDALLYMALGWGGLLLLGKNPFAVTPDQGSKALIQQLFMLPLAIYQWYLIANTGQSLGKKWLRMRIERADGQPVDFMSGVVLRSWVIGAFAVVPTLVGLAGVSLSTLTILSTAFSLVSLIDVLFIFGEGRRCLHDQIASTRVMSI